MTFDRFALHFLLCLNVMSSLVLFSVVSISIVVSCFGSALLHLLYNAEKQTSRARHNILSSFPHHR